MNTIAEQIKSSLYMLEVAERYGYHPNRAGFISCPFHSEKTASLRIYDHGFHCFGCGKGSSIIDFTMALFNISFPAAVVRLNADFNLGLTNGRPDPRQVEKMRQERLERERARLDYEAEYNAKMRQFNRLWAAYKAGNVDDPIYAEAARKIDYLEYWFSEHPFISERPYTQRGDTH